MTEQLMPRLPQKILALHQALTQADVAHAFGGALALAWCTERPRGTVDIDLNVFVDQDQVERVLDALPSQVVATEDDVARLRRDGQARLWWDETPVDLFLNTTDYHRELVQRVRWEPLAGEELPFLACSDLAVFKAFFDRTRDWADLEDMATAGTLELDRVLGVLVQHLGPGDPRVAHLQQLT